MARHAVVTHDEWVSARKALLEREKAFTRERDALSRSTDAPHQPFASNRPPTEQLMSGIIPLRTIGGARQSILANHDMAGCESYHASALRSRFDPICPLTDPTESGIPTCLPETPLDSVSRYPRCSPTATSTWIWSRPI